MKNRIYRSGIFQFVLVAISLLLTAAVSQAQYSKINIWPPNVGVFASQETQQFKAYGVPVGGGAEVDITNQVDWYLESNPFPAVGTYTAQDLEPADIATIDENGLLTILSTWGRVNVSCCYPKGCGPTNSGGGLSSVMSILLAPKFTVTPSAGAGGTIDPSSPVKAKNGDVEDFTLTPDLCYEVSAVNGTCGGTLNGNTFTTDPIVADCTVDAVFALTNSTATPAAINGTNDAGGAQTVTCGDPVTFTFGPADTPGDVAIIDGTDTCAGTLSDNGDGTWDYDIASLAGDCDAVVAFVPEFTVTPQVAGGTVDPTTAQTVPQGTQVIFTYTPTSACDVAQIDATNDDCGGNLTDNGNTTWDYTIASVSVDCTAAVEFVTPNYTATPFANNGTNDAGGAQIAACGEALTFTFGPADTPGDVATIDPTDTCVGTLGDNGDGTWDYDIASLTGNCNAVVTFLPTHTATPFANNGTNDAGGAQTVTDGSPVTFTFGPADTPGDVATIDAADTCGGTLGDNGDGTWDYDIASLTGDCNAVVNFVTPQFTLTLNAFNAGGDGRVYSSPGEADCDTTGAVYGPCPSSFDYDYGTVISLNHQEVLVVPVGTWAGWSGDGDCSDGSVTITTDVSCTGTFNAP